MNQKQHPSGSTAQLDEPQPAANAGQPETDSKKKRTWRIARAATAAVVLTGVGITIVTTGGDDASTSSDGPTPAETVAAAFESATSSSIHVSMEKNGKRPTDARIDYANGIVVTTGASLEYGQADSVIRDGSVYMRFEKGAKALSMEPGVWYKSSATDGPFASTAVVLDPEYLNAYVEAATEVIETGPVTFDGVDATRYTLTQDKNALADAEAKHLVPGASGQALTDLRKQLVATLPDSIEVIIDQYGNLVRMDEGHGDISRISDIGQPIELPAIDESEVEDLPTP
ncbi:hypothetical protein [Aldersonia kunmingensis]|uniref:hypothetical protein n=1 Tax=Aldersonia kunmingensis TaxID=408066 RepID=UPI00082998EE|nr:hypothetical protein [Aldersonia kunmingensis]